MSRWAGAPLELGGLIRPSLTGPPLGTTQVPRTAQVPALLGLLTRRSPCPVAAPDGSTHGIIPRPIQAVSPHRDTHAVAQTPSRSLPRCHRGSWSRTMQGPVVPEASGRHRRFVPGDKAPSRGCTEAPPLAGARLPLIELGARHGAEGWR